MNSKEVVLKSTRKATLEEWLRNYDLLRNKKLVPIFTPSEIKAEIAKRK